MTNKIISSRVNSIKPSPTMAVTAKAKELIASGRDVIGLGAGEPDFDTPLHIKEAAIKAISEGKTKYTAVDGITELKEAIAHKFKSDNNLDYKTNQISVGTGGKQILYNALQATLNKGDEVLIPAPFWVSYTDMVILAEGTPVIVETKDTDEFKLKPNDLEKSLTSKTKWIILNSPSNPTGTCYTMQELKSLGEVLENYPDVNIISDDIYEKITYDDFNFTTIAEVCPNLKNRTLCVNGVSKAYSMTGWRIGFAGGPEHLIKAMAKIQSQSTSNPTSISQYAALKALNSSEEFIKENNKIFKNRRDIIINYVNQSPGLSCNIPKGAFYIFPSCKGLFGKKSAKGFRIKDSTSFCEFLLEEAGVAAVPGIAFGMNEYFRISYATSESNLIKAGERITKACEDLIS